MVPSYKWYFSSFASRIIGSIRGKWIVILYVCVFARLKSWFSAFPCISCLWMYLQKRDHPKAVKKSSVSSDIIERIKFLWELLSVVEKLLLESAITYQYDASAEAPLWWGSTVVTLSRCLRSPVGQLGPQSALWHFLPFVTRRLHLQIEKHDCTAARRPSGFPIQLMQMRRVHLPVLQACFQVHNHLQITSAQSHPLQDDPLICYQESYYQVALACEAVTQRSTSLILYSKRQQHQTPTGCSVTLVIPSFLPTREHWWICRNTVARDWSL